MKSSSTFLFRILVTGRRILPAVLSSLLALSCCSCGNPQKLSKPITAQVYTMDTYMELTACGKDAQAAVDSASQALYQLNDQLSRTSARSVTTEVNHSNGHPVPINGKIRNLISESLNYSLLTNGKFDISIAPLADLWGFTRDEFQIPSEEEIASVLPYVGSTHIHLDTDQVSLDSGSKIDFGGIAKGFAAEQVADIFETHEIEHGLVNLGGDLLASGTRPDGKPWRIAIRDPAAPDQPDRYAGILELSDAYVLTSGSYERFFEEDDVLYHHIIDPQTGSPASSGLSSVTVIAEKKPGYGIMSDVLSTALFVMGADGALAFWRDFGEPFQMVLISDSGDVLVTDGLRNSFFPSDCPFFRYQFIRKENP